MIVQFYLENYRSFNERQTLTLLAEKKGDLLGNVVTFSSCMGLVGESLVKSIMLIGPNASGKSNLLRGIRDFINLIRFSADDGYADAFLQDCRFLESPEKPNKPTCFGIAFQFEHSVYEYDVSLIPGKVLMESLASYTLKNRVILFERIADGAEPARWTFDPSYERDPALEEKTRVSSLYLSTCLGASHPLMTRVFEAFDGPVSLTENAAIERAAALERCDRDPEFRHWTKYLLKKADCSVHDFHPKPDPNGGAMQAIIRRRIPDTINSIENNLEFESAGLQKIFTLASPLYDLVFHGKTAWVDDFTQSIHPLIARELLKIVHEPSKKQPKGQLIFAAHDVTLLDPTLLRRDQVCLTEKNYVGATTLVSLADFHTKADEMLIKGYLAGRYGAIPFPDHNAYEPVKKD